MKVAGTIGNYLKQKVPIEGEDQESPSKDDLSVNQQNSELDRSTTNSEVYDKELFEGLTAKQKKNLRKKLQRQRKKKDKENASQIESSIDLNESKEQDDGISDIANQEIEEIEIDVIGTD